MVRAVALVNFSISFPWGMVGEFRQDHPPKPCCGWISPPTGGLFSFFFLVLRLGWTANDLSNVFGAGGVQFFASPIRA